MGLPRALSALVLLLVVAGTSAQQLEHDEADILSLDELTLSSSEPCSLPEYGIFGKYDVAGSLGYGAVAPGGYGGYAGAAAVGLGYGSASPGQYAAAAGSYGTAAASGGYAGTAAAAELLQESHCKPLVVPGRLLSVGGLANCKGTFTPLAPQLAALASSSTTDALGRFKQTGATLGTLSWAASSSCIDSVTGLPLTYNWQLVAPVFDLLVVTDLALLTTPASAGLPPLEQGSGEVHDRVLRAFGVDANKLQIDMITYENVTSASPVWPALMGINAQLSFISHAVANTLVTLKNGPAATQKQHQQKQEKQQQLAQLSDIVGIQDAIWAVLQSSASGDGQALVTSRELIREVLSDTARRNKLPQLETFSKRGEEVLFDNIARIVATSNKDLLKPVVDVALSCATAALTAMPRINPECSVTSLAASVTSVSKLQKLNMTRDILALTNAYVITGDPVNTPDNVVPLEPVPANGTASKGTDGLPADSSTAPGAKKKPIEIKFTGDLPKLWAPLAAWFRARRQAAQDRRIARAHRMQPPSSNKKPASLSLIKPKFRPAPLADRVEEYVGHVDRPYSSHEEEDPYERYMHDTPGMHHEEEEDHPYKPAYRPKHKSDPKKHQKKEHEEEEEEEYKSEDVKHKPHTPKPRKPRAPKQPHKSSKAPSKKTHDGEPAAEEEEHPSYGHEYEHEQYGKAPEEDYPPGHPMYRHHEPEQYHNEPPAEHYKQYNQPAEQYPPGHPTYRPADKQYDEPHGPYRQYDPSRGPPEYKEEEEHDPEEEEEPKPHHKKGHDSKDKKHPHKDTHKEKVHKEEEEEEYDPRKAEQVDKKHQHKPRRHPQPKKTKAKKDARKHPEEAHKLKEEEEEQYTPSSGKKYLKETPHSEEENEYKTPKEKYNSHEGEQYTPKEEEQYTPNKEEQYAPKKQYDSEEEEAEYDPHKAEQADRYPQEEEEEEKEEEEENEKTGAHKYTKEEEEKPAKKNKKKWPTLSKPLMRIKKKAEQEAKRLQSKCAHGYDPEVCKHDLRPDCDYHKYEDGEYPPDSCHPYKSYPKSAAKALVATAAVDSDSWGNVEPDGVSKVPATRKGLTGLLGLLGMMGAVGVVPAGGLLVNSIAPLPLGTVVISPGLVLAPYRTPLSEKQSKGVLPWSFGGNCGTLGGHLAVDKITGNTPADVLKLIPQDTCLPRGWLYKMPNLADAGFSPSVTKLPPGTVVVKDDTIYVPKRENNVIKMLAKAIPGIEQAEWTTPKRAEEAKADAGVKVVKADGKQYVVINDASGRARLANTSPLKESEEPRATGLLHGNADCIKQGAPPASCGKGAVLGAVGLLSSKPAKALAPTSLEGAAVAVGYVQGCGGDFFSYTELAGAVEDVKKLSIDRRFSGVFKAFTTGEDAKALQTWGSFGVGNVTGRGHAFLTNTWACPDKIPEDAPVCIDSWTGVQLKVPIGGLTPYPKDYKRDRATNVDVTLSPLALSTLVNVSSSTDVSAAYKEAVKGAEVKIAGNAMTADPVRMVKSGKTPLVKQGVALMAENAKILNTLTTARALYECRSAPSPELSNELFVQWADKLVKQNVMTRPGPLKAALKDLCLEATCSDNAAAALLMLNKYLGMIRAKYEALPDSAKVPLSLVDDLVALAQLSHVGQSELYESIRSCCGLTGATSAGPLDDFVHRMDDLTRMTSIKTADIQQAAAMSLGGGVDTSSSSGSSDAEGAGEPTDRLESATSSMVGTLLNSGGIRDCKGVLYPLVEGEAPLALLTDGHGQFIVDEPMDGIYKFSSALKGSSCVDSLTGVPITFPMIQQVPATLAVTITAISLLSEPAKSDPTVREVVSVNGQVSPELLVNYVYRLYGLDAEELDVDFFSFTGNALQMGSPRLAQVSGAIAQTMATYTTGHSMLTALFNGKASSDQIATCIVAATYQRIAKAGNAIATLTEQEGLSAIYRAAYARCAPPARRRALLSADAGPAYAGIAAAFKDAHPAAAAHGDVWDQLASALAKSGSTVSSEVIDTSGKAAAVSAASTKPAANKASVGVASAAADAPTPGGKAAAVAKSAAAKKAAGTAPAAKPAAAQAAGPPEVDDLFAAAARVVAVSNQKIQQAVVQADRAASTHKGGFNVNAAMANISGVAAVQQSDFAATVGQLATTVAGDVEEGDGETNSLQRGLFQSQIADLEESFTGDALQDRISQKTAAITPSAVARNMGTVGKALAVDDEGHIGLLSDQAPKATSKVSPGIIAGAVVGGVLLIAAIAGLAVFLVRRRRSRAVGASGPFASGATSGGGDSVATTGGVQSASATPFASSGGGVAGAVSSPRKLKLIGRRSNGTDRSEGSTPRSAAGPVAEAVLDRSSAGSGYGSSGNNSVLLLSNNPLFVMPQSPVRSPAGNLRDLE